MPCGWRKESKRHSLAARGVKTSRGSKLPFKMSSRANFKVVSYYDDIGDQNLYFIANKTGKYLKDDQGNRITFTDYEEADGFIEGLKSVDEYKKERAEHPTLPKKAIKQIVKDHMSKGKRQSARYRVSYMSDPMSNTRSRNYYSSEKAAKKRAKQLVRRFGSSVEPRIQKTKEKN